ncbi:MAG: TIGR00730 family Rossman fold protein, partial [Duncaniella sp.]|nr:TIGR00730 family Rossman fold protein [Duncaniella sp.]
VVYCASSSQVPAPYLEAAYRMGALIARSHRPLISGGGTFGLMAATIEGALSQGGEAIGVLPRFMIERDWAHPRLTEMIATSTMHERKMTMATLSAAAVALPGGIGTLDELLEIMTWHQLGLYKGPVVIVNTDGYFDPLIEMFNRMIDQNFMRDRLIHATIVATPDEAMATIEQTLTGTRS